MHILGQDGGGGSKEKQSSFSGIRLTQISLINQLQGLDVGQVQDMWEWDCIPYSLKCLHSPLLKMVCNYKWFEWKSTEGFY